MNYKTENHFVSTTVSLQEIVDGKRKAVGTVVDAMRTRGWIFVKLSEDIVELARLAEAPLMKFFSSGKLTQRQIDKQREKLLHPQLGYDESDPVKPSLRILTGTELEQQVLSKAIKPNHLKSLSTSVDDALVGLTESLAMALFGVSPAKLGKDHKLPLLASDDKKATKKQPKYALLEAAYYRNKSVDREENCAPHYDPGLFSLNVLSNQPGLQFQDEEGNWVADPAEAGLGVLWTGWAATEAAKAAEMPEVKAAIHQVVHPGKMTKPRLSVWSEVCTLEQVFSENLFQIWHSPDKKIEFSTPTELLVPNVISAKHPYKVPVKEGGVLEAVKTVQQLKGLPMSKVIKVPIFNDDGEVVKVGHPDY